MASTSAADNATWHKGDTCLAPHPKDGTLREAIIQRLTSTFHSNDTAWLIFTHCDNDVDEEEEEEEEEEEGEAIPVSKLSKPNGKEFTQEKPVFPSIVTDQKLWVPFVLSSANGVRVPYTINRYLRDYQREGIRFMYNSYVRSSGCILGDDMGLGKTVQVIGFLAAVLHKTGTWEDTKKNRPQFLQSQIPSKQCKPNKVFLIVAPLSVLYNWKDELDAWGHFQCVVVHGLRKKEELARIKKGRIEVALTTYETLRLCLDQFNNISWSAVVVDEAHKIKNPNSQVTQAMKELDCKIRIGLTGTILQNNLEELWCVMDWAIPGCLGSLGHFKYKFSDPIEHGQRHSATKRALATGRKIVRALAKRISNWFLRRTKSLIKEQLPKKDDRVVYCSLTDFQRTVYQTVLETDDVTLLLRSSEKCDCHSGRTRRNCCYKRNSAGVEIKNLYFSYLAILRKVSNHVALLQSTAGTSKKQEKYLNAICQKVFHKFPEFVKRCKEEAFEALSDPMYSGKMKVLEKLLRFYLQKKDKVLLFSLSTKLLDVLENYCMAEGLDYSRLDGTTKAKERVQIVKEFNSSSHINLCLVSTMAGGLGLNFVGANVVVLFDPTWNPANDLQAIDRAYRIGQCRDVTVLRLISLGTIEETIYLRQIYKQQLQSSVVGKESSRRYFEAVQGHVVHKGELFGIKNLFRLQTQGTCLTRMILEREGHVEAGVMTTSTHTGEEREEGRKGVGEPADPPPTEGPAPNHEPVKESPDPATVSREVLDFSSGSEEDEDEYRLKRRPANPSGVDGNGSGNAATSPGQMNLAQYGFSQLLEKVKGAAETGEGSSGAEGSLSDTDAEDHEKMGKNKCASASGNGAGFLSTPGAKSRDVSSDSDKQKRDGGTGREDRDDAVKYRRKTAVDWDSDENTSVDKRTRKMKTTESAVRRLKVYSDESEDLDLDVNMDPKSHSGGQDRKRQTSSARDKTRSKYTGAIETYTSSEDEDTPVKKRRSTAGPKDGKKDKSIDSVLGGVQEVVYTHSNQRVVGGSKAEELISRAAVRDVFELKMFSQLPANQVVGSLESLPDSPPNSWPLPTDVSAEKPTADHPVTFASRSVHRVGHATFIIGETPLALRRQHLEEMSEKLNFPSVHEFASEILRRTSAQRVAWLRHYYTSLNQPDLTGTVTNNFPQPDSAQTSSASAAPSSTPTKTWRAKSHTGRRTTQEEVPKPTKRRKNTPKDLEHRNEPDIHPNNVSVPQKKSRILQNHSPEPRSKPQNPQEDVPEAQEKQRISRKNVLEPRSSVPSSESEEQEEMARGARGHGRTKRVSVSSSGARGAGGGLGVERAGSSGLGSGNPAASLNRTHRDAPSSPDLSHGRSTVLSKPTAQGREREHESTIRGTFQGRRENSQTPSPPPEQAASTSAHRSLLSDLIGDTSILDDLFKPKSRGVQQRGAPRTPPTLSGSASTCATTPPPSRITPNTDSADSLSSSVTHAQRLRTPPQVPRGGRKDFWDILNEGNEESISRLTDPAEVQRVCVNTTFSLRNRIRSEAEEEEDENKSLWKTNEKFLWKK